MELFKRPGSPSWYVDLVHPGTGERVRQSLKFSGSKVEAQKRGRRLELNLAAASDAARAAESATESPAERGPLSLREALDRYVAALASRGQVSAKNHAYRRDQLLRRIGGDTPLHALTTARLEEFVLARTGEGKKPQTVKHDLSLIRSATRYVGGLGYRVPVIPDWRVPRVIPKTRYLSPDEFNLVHSYLDPERKIEGRLLQAHLRDARQEVRDLFTTLAFTGGRWSEVAGLTWDRVDLPGNTLTLWGNKTQRERVVPIAETLREVLVRRSSSAQHERDLKGALIFPGPGGRVRAHPTRAIESAMSAVGLNGPDTVAKFGRATVHSLRHTFASWLIQNGGDLVEVGDTLGHASLNSTKRYAHLSKGKTLAKLGGILNGIRTPSPVRNQPFKSADQESTPPKGHHETDDGPEGVR